MYKVSNFTNNDDIAIKDQRGPFTVIEYKRDLSVSPANAIQAYYCNEMNIRKRQAICKVTNSGITTQTGAMQWMIGNVEMTSGITGAGDLLGKMVRGRVTGESAIKPEYRGNGMLILEPTYKYLILVDLTDWNNAIVLEDGLFFACESTIKHRAVMRSNFSSAVAGGEGLFNLCLKGNGVVCLESYVPQEELITIDLDNDVVKIDGSMAIAWSESLNFSVERSGKSLIGSATSGEGLVNVYRGTGRILMAPVISVK